MTAHPPESPVPDGLEAFVRALPGPRNRLHDPDAMQQAERLVLDGWRAAGWEVRRVPFTLHNAIGRQDHDGFDRRIYDRLDGANLVAIHEGTSRECIVVGAHLDTVRDSPGACDNGAAVAILVELAQRLGALQSSLTIVLVAFDFEEIGVLGAHRAAADLVAERPVLAAIVLESIGWFDVRPGTQRLASGFDILFPRTTRRLRRRGLRADWTAVVYRSSAKAVADTLASELRYVAGSRHAAVTLFDPLGIPVLERYLRRVAPSLRQLSRSDHVAFWDAGIPAVQVTDTANLRSTDYHRMSDTADGIDFGHVAKVATAVTETVRRLAGVDGTAAPSRQVSRRRDPY